MNDMNDISFAQRFIAARRAAIASGFSYLNAAQLEGVLTTEGPLLLLAGAGSGKTTVLINRIANILRYGRGSDCDFVPETAGETELQLLEDYTKHPDPELRPAVDRLCAVDPCEPWRIIAITFTNKAAEELKARLATMLGESALDIWASTFHSACARILRREIDRLGYDTRFTIYDTADSLSILKKIVRELNLDDKTYAPKYVLGHISRAKDAMQDAEAYARASEKSGDFRLREISKIYMEYERRLKAANALDFDDLIFLTVKLLYDFPDVRDFYQRKFRYVLIDEYQDTNNLQYMLAAALTGEKGNICVVGDDDQSIYKFRGATIENILSFEKHYKNARVIKLEQNYRSTKTILGAANAVIRNNTGRKGKELWTDKHGGAPITLRLAENEQEEAAYIAAKMLEGKAAGRKFSDYAVLYRMNAQSSAIEYALKRNGIPYRVIGGMRFFERAEIKDMLAYLCVVNNPEDDLRLTRIINNPPRGIGERTIELAAEAAAREHLPLYSVLRRCDTYPELSKAKARIIPFMDMMDALCAEKETLRPDILYAQILDKSGYLAALQAKGGDENTARIENIRELQSNIVTYMEDSGDESLSGFLDTVSLYTDTDQLDNDTDAAILMTMHSAKGLEFPVVFIAGAEEGIFPGTRVIGDPDDMEEERRLCYVAITRAKEKLYMTCAERRRMFGLTTANKPSRFTEEIPAEYMERSGERRHEAYLHQAPGILAGGSRGMFSNASYTSRLAAQRSKQESVVKKSYAPSVPASAALLPEYHTGDMVQHKAFGRGMVTSIQKMGNDALIEIAFDDVGTKRLMLKAAAAHMTKL